MLWSSLALILFIVFFDRCRSPPFRASLRSTVARAADIARRIIRHELHIIQTPLAIAPTTIHIAPGYREWSIVGGRLRVDGQDVDAPSILQILHQPCATLSESISDHFGLVVQFLEGVLEVLHAAVDFALNLCDDGHFHLFVVGDGLAAARHA